MQRRFLGTLTAVGIAATLLALAPGTVGTMGTQRPETSDEPAGPVLHAYHKHAPGTVPPTLDPKQLPETNRSAFVAYSIASRIRKLLYQEPCYCPCDQNKGHRSLLDCYTSRHGVECTICKREVFYIFEQSKQGRTPSQIRKSIADSSWLKVDLQRYTDEHYSEFSRYEPHSRSENK